MSKKNLPMRTGVGVILLNQENKVFVGKRKDNPIDKWQMPQGGVDKGEDFLSAMKRELYEETSIKNIKILKEINGFFQYELPENLVGIIWNSLGNYEFISIYCNFKKHKSSYCGSWDSGGSIRNSFRFVSSYTSSCSL